MKMTVKKLMVGLFVGLCFIISACNDGPDAPDELARWYEEVAIIDNNLASSGITPWKDPESGIRMIISKLGTGLPAQKNNTVDVDYIGRRFEDKVVFDQGNIALKLSQYIDGWQIAFSKLPAGSEAKLIIPSFHAYGAAGQGSDIPPNTILEFDVKFNEATLSSTEAARLGTDTTAIDTYLDGKGIDAIKDSTGLRYVITSPGGGVPLISWYDKISMKYTIKLLTDDTKAIISVDRAPSDTFYSRPVDYIIGMMIGLQKLSIGSKAVLYIPSTYAFGADSVSDGAGNTIPANANLIVEVEITDVE